MKKLLTSIFLAALFSAPIAAFAETVYEANFEKVIEVTADSSGRYAHCFKHNLNYLSNARCGDGGSGEMLAQEEEYGPFLCGVCQKCIDSGECSLTDIMIATGNVGNFLLGIVGSIALLLFVIGGMYWLTAAGDKNKISRGKQFIFAAAIGIALTFGAILILRTAISILTTGTPGYGPSGGVVCDGTNNGATCGDLSECYGGVCTQLCDITRAETGLPYSCTDPNTLLSQNACVPNRCPGGNDNVCCDTTQSVSDAGE
jgi:hypothetical protein